MNATDVRVVGRRLSNRGRWGDDDQLGTVNHIGPEQVRAALAVPQQGRVISCGIDFNADGPMSDRGRYNPRLFMLETGATLDLPGGFHYADDVVEMSLQCATQWDGLAHVYYDGEMYNGQPSSLITKSGAKVNSIDALRDGVVGRAVLLDVARLKGRDQLELDAEITPADLDACLAAATVELRRGDIVLVRTGFVGRQVASGTWDDDFFLAANPGLSFECAEWLHGHEVAAVASDNIAVEAMPGSVTDCMLPLHMVCLRDMGMTFGELFNLDPLAAACAEAGRYEGLLTAPPLPITGAVGSPINPLVII